MKPGQLAKLLNLSPATIRQWSAKEFHSYLSPKGQGVDGAYRSYDELDARIIAWIALLKAQNTPVEEIHLILKQAKAEHWKTLPPLPGGVVNDEPIAVVPREAAEERLQAIQERFQLQLDTVVKERDELKTQVEQLRGELQRAHEKTENLYQSRSEEVETLTARITELSTKEAELRGKLEQYTVRGKRVNAATLVIAAFIVGGIFTLLLLITLTLLNVPR